MYQEGEFVHALKKCKQDYLDILIPRGLDEIIDKHV